jgi:superfamily II DNA or RNA helicase
MKIPHKFQVDAVEAALEFARCDINSVIAAPVGSGKSLMAGMCAQHYARQYNRVLVLAHRKELVQQNAAEIEEIGLRCGIVSAGIGRFNSSHLCTVASVQTLANRSIELCDLIVIDECHRMQWAHRKNSQYAKVIGAHPGAALIGLSGTPFRTSGGDIYGSEPWKWFSRLAANIPMLELMEQGYLCRPTSVPADSIIDESRLEISRSTGDYTEASMREARAGNLRWAVLDAIDKMNGRQSIIVFASDIAECEEIGELLREAGESVAVVHSQMEDDRDGAVAAFKRFAARWLVTRDIALEGFNHPATDGIVWLRPTQSIIVWIQGNGRGIRIWPGKLDCLVLDYVGNIQRNGAIDDPDYQYWPRICEKCEAKNPPNQRHCIACGHCLIEQKEEAGGVLAESIEAPLELAVGGGLLSDERKNSWLDVLEMGISLSKNGKGTIIARIVAEDPGGKIFSFQVFFSPKSEHSWARKQAHEFLDLIYPGQGESGILAQASPRVPARVMAKKSNDFWRISRYQYDD